MKTNFKLNNIKNIIFFFIKKLVMEQIMPLENNIIFLETVGDQNGV
jgi:hypothetical protein